MKRYGWVHSMLGITLTEMMIAMATSGILLAAVVSLFVTQQKSYVVQTQIADMTVNARTALDRLTRDIRLAGYGLPREGWTDWIDWVKDQNGEPLRFSDPVSVLSHDQASDQLMLIGAFERPVGYLSSDALVGDTDLRLRYEAGVSRLDKRDHNMIYIGRNEPALVTAIPGSQGRQHLIRIDTNPNQPGDQGVAWSYTAKPISHPVELISVVTYKVVIDSQSHDAPIPVLKRDTNTGGGAQPLAEYIEDLRFTRHGDTLTVTITARTANPDQNYIHPRAKDRYRRLTLNSQVKLRGIRF
jgi:type II secretory pathway pseudopilin PulG